MSTSRAPVTTSEHAQSPEMWTVAPRSSAWTHEHLPEPSSLSSCPSFQPSFLSLITSDFPVIKLNFVLFGKSSFWESFSERPWWRVREAGSPLYPAVQTEAGRRGLQIAQHLAAGGAAGLPGCRVSSRSSLSPSTGFTSDSEPPCHVFFDKSRIWINGSCREG